jgi:hypothetical protein
LLEQVALVSCHHVLPFASIIPYRIAVRRREEVEVGGFKFRDFEIARNSPRASLR